MPNKKESIATKILTGLRGVWPAQAANEDKGLNKSLLTDPAFLEFVNMSPAGISIFSYETVSYEYFSPNLLEMIGYPAEKLEGIGGAEFTVNTFHPDHLGVVFQMMEIVKKYYYEYALQNRIMDTRFTWTVQTKKSSGESLWTLMQTNMLEVNAEGFPKRVLIFVSDISDIKTNSKVDFVFSIKEPDGRGYEPVYISHFDPASAEYVLTEREIEILKCISKGMRNHEIADTLHISKHTVITHRRNIMKKSGKDNIIQLLME